MDFFQKYHKDVDQKILDFVKGKEFNNLKEILEQKALGQIHINCVEKDESKIVRNNIILATILSICSDLELDVERILEERRNTQENKN